MLFCLNSFIINIILTNTKIIFYECIYDLFANSNGDYWTFVHAVKRAWVLKQDAGDGKMKEISDYIYEGALAFLKAEYRLLTFFVIGASAVLAGISFIVPTTHILIVVAFVFGAFFSALAGNMGMKIATKTNVRTTQAARTSLPQALKVSFSGEL